MGSTDFKLHIRTEADLADLQAATREINATSAAAQRANQATGRGGFLAQLKGAGAGVVRELPGGNAALRLFEKLGGKLGVIAGGLLGARRAISEFSQAQDVWAGVDAALAQTGQLTEASREKINDLAGAMQNLTGIGDDTWASIAQDVIQFGGSVGEIVKHIEAVKNYAGILKGDLMGASTGYKQALAGNFMMFSRLGFEVDKNASKTENLAHLWQFLADHGGGQLEARGRTLSGQWRLLKNNTGDVFEAFGRLIAKTGFLQGSLALLANITGYVATLFGGVPPKLEGLQNGLPQLSRKAQAAQRSMKGAGTAATDLGDDMAAGTEGVGELGKKVETLEEQFSKATEAMKKQRDELAALIDAQKDYALAQIDIEEAMSKDKSPAAKEEFERQRALVKLGAEEAKSKTEAADLEKRQIAALEKQQALEAAVVLGEIEAEKARAKAGDIAGKVPAAGVRPDLTGAEFDKLRGLRAGEMQRAEEELGRVGGPFGLERTRILLDQVKAWKKQIAAMDEIRDAFLEMSEAQAAYRKANEDKNKQLPEVLNEIETIKREETQRILRLETSKAQRKVEVLKAGEDKKSEDNPSARSESPFGRRGRRIHPPQTATPPQIPQPTDATAELTKLTHQAVRSQAAIRNILAPRGGDSLNPEILKTLAIISGQLKQVNRRLDRTLDTRIVR